MIDDDIRALRTALTLAALIDKMVRGDVVLGYGEQQVARVNTWEVFPPRGVELAAAYNDAAFIAAASPDRIARLLDEVERLRAEVSVAAREAQTLRNQRDELRIILDKRPAMNDGLREAYAKWSAGVYALDWMDAADIDAARKEEGK